VASPGAPLRHSGAPAVVAPAAVANAATHAQGRRGLMSAGVAAGFSAMATGQKARAAEVGWQLKMPEGWEVSRQKGIPGRDDVRPQELLMGLNQVQRSEVKVVRIPLVTTERDPQGIGGLVLIEYFGTPEGQSPRVTTDQTIDILVPAFKNQPAIFNFGRVGVPQDIFRKKQKYLRYDFEAGRCEGAQVQGVKGKVCQRSDNGEILPVLNRHHAILTTVASEPDTGGGGILEALGFGQPPRSQGTREVMWVVDVSGPAEVWPKLEEQAKALFASFAVGSEGELAASRGDKVKGQAPAAQAA